MNASCTLPKPTNNKIVLDEGFDYEDLLNIISSFKDVIDIDFITEEGLYDPEITSVSLNNKGVEQIKRIGELFRTFPNILKVPDTLNLALFGKDVCKALGITYEFTADSPYETLGMAIVEQLTNIIDKHNMYLTKLSKHNLSMVINNLLFNAMYDIISDPANLMLAHIPVDVATEALKKIADADKSISADLKTRTPGNVVNKYESIRDNLVGKDGIALCAVALKSFFALSLFLNAVLNYGTPEILKTILFSSKGITINGKTYNSLANIRALDPSTILDLRLLKHLAEVNNDIDAAIVLSALLSLSTDNAKELKLSKLNAGTKTMDMYLYGISIGMPFKEISDILMSPIGTLITELTDGDVFDETRETIQINSKFFNYFDRGPYELLNPFKKDFRPSYLQGRREIPYNYLQNIFTLKFEEYFEIEKDDSGKKIKKPLESMLKKIGQDPNLSLDEKLAFINALRFRVINNAKRAKKLRKEHEEEIKLGLVDVNGNIKDGEGNFINVSSVSPQFKAAWQKLLDFCETYIYQQHILSQNMDMYKDIKTLAKGAREFSRAGKIFGLNKGIPSNQDDLLKKIESITMLIVDRKKEMRLAVDYNTDVIDLYKFVEDEKYRLDKINEYEKIKVSFNVLRAIDFVPHFFGYVKALALADKSLAKAYTYREVQKEHLNFRQEFNLNSLKLTKNMQNYIQRFIIKQWFKNSSSPMVQTARKITIPAGNIVFDENQNEIVLKQPLEIDLATEYGLATFKLWIERDVLPNLLKGIYSINGQSDPTLKNNKFIKNLTFASNSRTVSGNPELLITLPISMLPRSDSERARFDLYKGAFNLLAAYRYEYDAPIYSKQGSEIVKKSNPHSQSIIDLFTLYALVANNWKQSETSLVPILEDFLGPLKSYLILDLHNFELAVDSGMVELPNPWRNGNGVIKPEVLYSIAEVANTSSTKASLIKGKWKLYVDTGESNSEGEPILKIELSKERQLLQKPPKEDKSGIPEDIEPNEDSTENDVLEELNQSGVIIKLANNNGFKQLGNFTELFKSGEVNMPFITKKVLIADTEVEINYNPQGRINYIKVADKIVYTENGIPAMKDYEIPVDYIILENGTKVPVINSDLLNADLYNLLYPC